MAWLTGYPREKINWFPTIDPEKCVKCGMCINCANLCLGNAIAFPDIKEVREIYRREGIWAKVKKQLAEEGKLQIRKV